MSRRLRFDVDGRDWPNGEYSRFVEAGGVRWHVQVAGDGPTLLLLIHGTGASGHSWRDFIAPFRERCTVVVPDLPGHGFSAPAPSLGAMSLPGIASALGSLCRTLALPTSGPQILVGHSAGAAILMRAALDRAFGEPGDTLISLSGALLPFPGVAGHLLTPVARGMARLPFVAETFAWHVRSDSRVIAQLLRQTGSSLDARGTDLYRRLAGNTGHVQAALDMMAQWDLHALARDLPRLRTSTLLVGADRDGTVPARQALQAAERIEGARTLTLKHLGHLAHEEAPDRVARLIDEVIVAAAS
ncbi:MAG: alpha/beta fold hydrolase BchO [Pseudomonadota bacterium]